MEYKEIKLDKFIIAGISVRTINKDGKAQQDIGQLWGEFFEKDIAASIPDKASDDIYCVYTDYESDYTGGYTTIIGCKVYNTNNIPDGLVIKEIQASKYQEYTSTGKIPDAVAETWFHIWKSDIDRKYTADFEVYGKETQNPIDATVKTYLSIK